MSEDAKKTTPAYATYKSFLNLINSLRDGPIPPTIEYSVVSGSNSGKATMLASLKALKLIDNEKRPTELFKSLITDTENYESNLRKALTDAYPFLFDGNIDLNNTTTEQVVERFKSAGANGSTVSKGMSFFISAAKEAGIGVSARVKPPQATKPTNGSKRRTTQKNQEGKKDQGNNRTEFEVSDPDFAPEGMERITVPLRGMDDGIIFFPDGLSVEDAKRAVKAAVFNLKHYYELDED